MTRITPCYLRPRRNSDSTIYIPCIPPSPPSPSPSSASIPLSIDTQSFRVSNETASTPDSSPLLSLSPVSLRPSWYPEALTSPHDRIKREAKQMAKNLISRTPNDFMLYRSERGRYIKDRLYEINQTMISRNTSKSWKSEPPEVRERFKGRQRELKRQHDFMKLQWIKDNFEEVKNLAASEGMEISKRRDPEDYLGLFSSPNTFMLYRNDKLKEILASNPGLNQKVVSAMAASDWKHESKEVKEWYKSLSKKMKANRISLIAQIEEKRILRRINISYEPEIPSPPSSLTFVDHFITYNDNDHHKPTQPSDAPKDSVAYLHRISSLMNPVSDND
ncbi:hypothetical protein H4219_001748 [Mycoemilia scoparia]|uniref:HMG box domain-containing protein n=1 Tax=Mycoemilia scoparia TaxID=417184 RepID=A0A9W8A7H2_9FUNG|nr:hypothetical protein H4219_001748 [Mycoemilia scoparia]